MSAPASARPSASRMRAGCRKNLGQTELSTSRDCPLWHPEALFGTDSAVPGFFSILLRQNQVAEGPGAQCKLLGFQAEALKHRKEQIAERRTPQTGRRKDLVLAVPKTAAGQNDRQVVIGVRVAITHPAAEQHHGSLQK